MHDEGPGKGLVMQGSMPPLNGKSSNLGFSLDGVKGWSLVRVVTCHNSH